jgi:hypothetical protein
VPILRTIAAIPADPTIALTGALAERRSPFDCR